MDNLQPPNPYQQIIALMAALLWVIHPNDGYGMDEAVGDSLLLWNETGQQLKEKGFKNLETRA